ncbi:MAG: hypothetical protein SGBAC_002721 [Bacillariaceae sp.]
MTQSESQVDDPGNRKRKLETTTNVAQCCTCKKEFPSRNQLFKKLQASNNGCCDPIFVSSTTVGSSFRSSQEGEIQHKRVVLIVAYLGKNYHGSARNDCTDSVPTVEGCLWNCVGQAFPEDSSESIRQAMIAFQDHIATKTNPKAMTRSSRTDKGVSALGNVFSVMLPWVWSTETDFAERVNAVLPDDICLLRTMCQSDKTNLPQSFDARSHCEGRRYRYFVPAHVLFRKGADIENESIMDLRKRLKKVLLQWGGTHSFHNFTNWKPEFENRDAWSRGIGKKANKIKNDDSSNSAARKLTNDKPEDDPTFFRHILRCHVEDVVKHNETDFVIISIKGQSFLYHQIRKMMGTTIAIMSGSLPEDFITKAFQEAETSLSEDAPLAPSEGLVMVEAIYSKYCSKHTVEPIGLGSTLLHREKKKTDRMAEKEDLSRRESWKADSAKLLRDTRDFQKRVYHQMCQDQLRKYQASPL